MTEEKILPNFFLAMPNEKDYEVLLTIDFTIRKFFIYLTHFR